MNVEGVFKARCEAQEGRQPWESASPTRGSCTTSTAIVLAMGIKRLVEGTVVLVTGHTTPLYRIHTIITWLILLGA